jgi:flavin reductase (DIM6/NTAB) family NADH-FMN oxidoreductase RutF
MSDRDGVARLTRVAPAAAGPDGAAASDRTPMAGATTVTWSLDAATTSARHAIETHIGMARLTPRSAAAERAARELRQVMGRFATGVTVVTTAHRGLVHGMTANAFLSVSLRPPLVLVSLGRSRMSELLPRAGRYGISVLAADQEHLAAHFAGRSVSPVAPTFEEHQGLPLLGGALAHVGCTIVDVHTAGDHVLWIGEVVHMRHRDGDPLLFYCGRFGALADPTGDTAGDTTTTHHDRGGR